MSGTAGGTESIFTNSTYLDWGKWIHLAISLENGGTNASTARIYKNGSLASTVTGMTVPDVVSRSSQYIGRSSTSWEAYFAGDLDDFRLYGSALSTTDIEAIFAETSAGVHYQAQALNNPTGFSATGLPVGLSIDPITGAITGHTTEIGDHNISLTASNLSGTSESKTVRITVTPQKPLLTTIATNSIGSNSATATATLLETGGVDTTLEVFYGAADKGETVIGWDSNSSLPNAQNTGDIELGMSGLSANTSYFYRIHASNSAGSTWSDAVSFTSGVQLQPPSISSEDASNIAGTSATTNGNLLSFDGSNQPTITLYYGLTDPFLPLSLGNTLKIWLDAEDTNSFQLSGSNITKWYNKFGNGYVFDQKTGDPSRTVVNGRNVVNLDGDDQLWTNDAFLASNYTILSVSRLTGGQNARLITSRDRNWIVGYWGGRVDTFFFNEGLNWGGTYNADTNWHLHAVTMNNSDQGNTWVDFVQTTTNGNGAHDTSYEPSKISFGAYSVLQEPSMGEIAELLVFDSVLPTSDRQKMEGYLAYKWGLTNSIPDDHPYKTSSPSSQVPATAVSLGQKPIGAFNSALSNLQSGTTYKYRFTASNPGGVDISSIKSFTTLGLPSVETLGASDITKTSAKLNANLTFANGSDTSITFYWNTSDGGTTPSTWTAGSGGTHTLSGTHGISTLSHTLSGLTTGTTYYYTVKAVNPQGTVWGTTKTFVPANTALNQYSIPDLVLWLDASDIDGDSQADSITSAVSVSSWTDKSASGIGVSQSNPDLQPSQLGNQFGNKPAVRFDGTGDVLNLGSIRTSSGGYSAYALVKRASESGDDNAHLLSESTWSLIPSTSKDAFSAKVVKSSSASSKTLTNIKLGKSASTTTNDFGGDLAELLIFSRELNSTEEPMIEGYLAHRWGATDSLSSVHTYKSIAPIFDNKPLIGRVSNYSPKDIIGMKLWLDATDSGDYHRVLIGQPGMIRVEQIITLLNPPQTDNPR